MSSDGDRRLSMGQEALWFLYRMAPESAAYNVLLAVRIRTAVDPPRLQRALTAVAERHDVLRSTIVDQAGTPVRRIGPADRVRLVVRPTPAEEFTTAARTVAAEPFRLDREVPLRAVLLRDGPADAVLVLVTHHIASDATSQWLLARDLFRAYESDGALPPLPGGGFEAAVAAERALLDSDRRPVLERYWRDLCAGVPAAELPADRPRPATPVFRGASHTVWFPDPLADRVRVAARDCGVTPFALLLGALQAVLHRYTGLTDFLIGCPVSVRFRRELRDVVGYLANSTVLRAHFDREATFASTARAAYREVAQAMAHAGFPYPALTALLGPARSAPVFTVAVTLLAADRLDPPLPMVPPGEVEGAEVEYAGLRLALLDLPQMEGQFDVLVELRTSGTGGLSAVVKYDANLFEPPTVERFAAAYTRFVEVAAGDPDTLVSRTPLVDPAELRALLALGTGGVDS
ncbi:condensation domain-containing protein [Plantactinospora sp. B5E13]|uniref:condensation domain-containing protein n=1 Tax=unclassified Plantactinospora TaxID=2631981 RepID=UPI00325C707C